MKNRLLASVLTLADRREIRFIDPRRFGRLSLHRAVVNQQLTTNNQQPIPYTGPGREPSPWASLPTCAC